MSTNSTLHFLNALAALDELRTCRNENLHYELDAYAEQCMTLMNPADKAEFKRAVQIWSTL